VAAKPQLRQLWFVVIMAVSRISIPALVGLAGPCWWQRRHFDQCSWRARSRQGGGMTMSRRAAVSSGMVTDQLGV
jgi:hypothetical protein